MKYVLVPVEPTREMRAEGGYCLVHTTELNYIERGVACLKAMLAARPNPLADAEFVEWFARALYLTDDTHSDDSVRFFFTATEHRVGCPGEAATCARRLAEDFREDTRRMIRALNREQQG